MDEARGVLDAIRANRSASSRARRARCSAGRAYELDERAEIAQALVASGAAVGRQVPVVGASFWTDAQILAGAGIPSVIFGPGGAGLHSTEEYVTLDEVVACRDVLVDLARRFLG